MTSERFPMTDGELLKFANNMVDIDPADAEPTSVAHAQACASLVIARTLLRIEAHMKKRDADPYEEENLASEMFRQRRRVQERLGKK